MAVKSQNIALIKRLVCEGCIKGSVDEFGK